MTRGSLTPPSMRITLTAAPSFTELLCSILQDLNSLHVLWFHPSSKTISLLLPLHIPRYPSEGSPSMMVVRDFHNLSLFQKISILFTSVNSALHGFRRYYGVCRIPIVRCTTASAADETSPNKNKHFPLYRRQIYRLRFRAVLGSSTKNNWKYIC